MIIQMKTIVPVTYYLEKDITGDGIQKRLKNEGWIFPDGFHFDDEKLDYLIQGGELPSFIYIKNTETQEFYNFRRVIAETVKDILLSESQVIKMEPDREEKEIIDIKTSLTNLELWQTD